MVWLRQESGGELVCRSRWFEAGLRLELAPGQVREGILAEMLDKITRAAARRGGNRAGDVPAPCGS